MEKKDAEKTPILGYLITGEYNHKLDPDPSAIGVPALKSSVLNEIQERPLEFVGIPSYGNYASSYSLNSAEQLTSDDWTIEDVKKNLSDEKLQLQGKLDARISDDINFTLGGNFSHHIDMGSSLWWRKQLLNFDNNRQYTRDNYNFYARIQHKLSGDDTQSSVKNVFYTLQADYSAYNAKLGKSKSWKKLL